MLLIEVAREDEGRWTEMPNLNSVLEFSQAWDQATVHAQGPCTLSNTLAILVTALLVACSEHDESISTDTLAESKVLPVLTIITPARYAWGCPAIPPDPPVSRAVFDIHLRRPGMRSASSDSAAQSITLAGGRILHRFHVNAMRAELDTATVRGLVYGPNAIAEVAEQVLDLRSLNIPVQVRYNRPATTIDSAQIARLGGVVSLAPFPRPSLNAVVPDSVVPALVRMPGVLSVFARSVACGRFGTG